MSSQSEVSLVGITVPRIKGLNTAEDLVAYAARVSNPANQLNTLTATKLLKYLANNKHWSPFEMVHILLEIKTTRDIGRQILRHRSFSFQEFSQRYAAVQSDFEIREARFQDTKNRQNSIDLTEEHEYLKKEWEQRQKYVALTAEAAYSWALKNNIAKEQARAVLPEGMTMSTMYMSGTLRSWLHYIVLRTEAGTQKEHREIANKCKEIILQEFPSLSSLFEYEIQESN